MFDASRKGLFSAFIFCLHVGCGFVLTYLLSLPLWPKRVICVHLRFCSSTTPYIRRTLDWTSKAKFAFYSQISNNRCRNTSFDTVLYTLQWSERAATYCKETNTRSHDKKCSAHNWFIHTSQWSWPPQLARIVTVSFHTPVPFRRITIFGFSPA